MAAEWAHFPSPRLPRSLDRFAVIPSLRRPREDELHGMTVQTPPLQGNCPNLTASGHNPRPQSANRFSRPVDANQIRSLEPPALDARSREFKRILRLIGMINLSTNVDQCGATTRLNCDLDASRVFRMINKFEASYRSQHSLHAAERKQGSRSCAT